MTIQEIIQQQRVFFDAGKTKDIAHTKRELIRFRDLLKANEPIFYDAIYQDFGKSEFETYLTELGLIYHELKLMIKKFVQMAKTTTCQN